ncbi:hypothetical protein QOZ94_003563 [Xanthobacter agilis]|jgi:hypothetical protein|uniref:Uncharacterized protein n=1 Tax=Xanthobacter agilis TaxID=47492 RepID=A0ABU0LHZ4_XANAG|nr:hypothetical protein [Xanthobacter agilis]
MDERWKRLVRGPIFPALAATLIAAIAAVQGYAV